MKKKTFFEQLSSVFERVYKIRLFHFHFFLKASNNLELEFCVVSDFPELLFLEGNSPGKA